MDRNPYVILGIPFGASRAEANAAFARKARALSRDGADLDLMTDLTWALQRIDVSISEPATAMEIYRIPADPEAFQGEGKGVLHPPPERLAPAGGDRDAALETLRHAAAREYLRHLVTVRAARIALPPP
ncbi:hypothetical protein [Trebonia sp.]|uniref:hypothetical protein n=1 Tax=Trebonia sp. TaxID=2767075 RepID=UPI00260B3A5A|nr:hypothetical protein [Trebonia sp.]